MIIMQAAGLDKYLGGRQILKTLNFTLLKGEKVGLVGSNGTGKSTFLKCLTGNMGLDAGQVFRTQSLAIGYLEQVSIEDAAMSAWEFVMEAFRNVLNMRGQLAILEEKMKVPSENLDRLLNNYARLQEEYEKNEGYACENTARRILTGLGFSRDQYKQQIGSFSGGQKTRLKLAQLLAAKPECMVLDEPTNHLDMASVEWLEQYLTDFSGTLLLVSHDRMLLDKVPNRIVELRNGELQSYQGNYTNYLRQRAEQDLVWERAYSRQQEYISKTEDFIARYRAGIKAKQARGRQAQLNRLERMEKQPANKTRPGWVLPEIPRSGEEALLIEGLEKGFSGNTLFSRINFRIGRGEKIALVGPNGCGKSTLLRILQGLETADQGSIAWGSRIRIGYFAQENQDLNPDNTLLDEILHNFDLTIEQARNYLGSILFSGDDVYKKVGKLSGGEQGRLSLLKVLLKQPNFLILDEPTNHLDIHGRQAAEDLLSSFPGSLLLVSHDRYFIDQVCERLLVFEDKCLTYYWGDYTYYSEKRKEMIESIKTEENSIPRTKENKKPGTLPNKPSPSTLKFKLGRLEEQIEEWEEKKKHLENSFSDPEFLAQGTEAREGWGIYKELEKKLEEAYAQWEVIITQMETSY